MGYDDLEGCKKSINTKKIVKLFTYKTSSSLKLRHASYLSEDSSLKTLVKMFTKYVFIIVTCILLPIAGVENI